MCPAPTHQFDSWVYLSTTGDRMQNLHSVRGLVIMAVLSKSNVYPLWQYSGVVYEIENTTARLEQVCCAKGRYIRDKLSWTGHCYFW